MKIMKKKTRRAINKTMRKMIKRHGREIAAGLVGSIASALATLAATEAPGADGRSNLTKMSKKISKTITDKGRNLSARASTAKNARTFTQASKRLERPDVQPTT
jgi:hypothetical protein